MRLIHTLVFTLFGTILFADAWFLKGLGPINRLITSFADLLSVVIAMVLVVYLASGKRLDMPAKYVIIGFFISAHLFAGALINMVQPGAVFSGIRVYFKYAPLFLLPMIVVFSERDVMRYLKFVLALSVLQAPVALYQRFVAFPSSIVQTGDVVRGTLSDSGNLSVYLISVIAVLTAFYVRKRISRMSYGILLFVLFIPTTINETKSTLILLPLALLLPALFDATRGQIDRLRALVPVAFLGVLLMGFFVTMYDMRWGDPDSSILAFLTEGKIFDKLYKEQEPGQGYDTGRIDSIVIALRELSADPVHVAVGLGMGNVAMSFSRVLGGEYEEYADYGVRVTTISYLAWEAGVIGVFLVYIFLYLLFRDARALRHRPDFVGIMGLAWGTVIVLMGISMFYKSLIDQSTISYLFWFLSGYLVAENVRQRQVGNDPTGISDRRF